MSAQISVFDENCYTYGIENTKMGVSVKIGLLPFITQSRVRRALPTIKIFGPKTWRVAERMDLEVSLLGEKGISI